MINKDMPNFLFIGSSGTGKTTTAKIIIKTLNAESLVLNSSLDRKIEIVRERVREFARTMSHDNKLKIIFMDEADGLLPATQEALRNIIETYSEYVRFIFTANNEGKITEAIKSRCAVIGFTELNKDKIYILLHTIYEKEVLKSEFGEWTALQILIDKLYPDIRKMINELQKLTKNGTEPLKIEKVNSVEILSEKLIQLIKEKKILEARELFYNDGAEPELIFKEMYMRFMLLPYDISLKQQINEIAKQSNYWMSNSLHKSIAFESWLFGLTKVKL
mgnify:CR=1 FL=1